MRRTLSLCRPQSLQRHEAPLDTIALDPHSIQVGTC